MSIYNSTNLDLDAAATTTQYAPLGALASKETSAGLLTYIYVENGTGAAWTVGQAVMRRAGLSTYSCTVASTSVAPSRVVGVAQVAVPAASFAWVLRDGVGSILADGSVTADTSVIISAGTAGSFTDSGGVTAASLGLALATDAGATIVAAHVHCTG